MRYYIFMEMADGEILKIFAWCGNSQSGIDHAWCEAKSNGYADDIVNIWAEARPEDEII